MLALIAIAIAANGLDGMNQSECRADIAAGSAGGGTECFTRATGGGLVSEPVFRRIRTWAEMGPRVSPR